MKDYNLHSCHRWVTNKYTGKRLYVPCGKCRSCQKDKSSKRANRIRSEASRHGTLTMFVTLTYDNLHVPCFHIDRCHDGYISLFRGVSGCLDADVYSHIRTFKISDLDLSGIKKLRGQSNPCCGLLYYKDIINFKKRLYITFLRNYGKKLQAKIYSVGEYGRLYQRPHFHLLITCPASDFDRVECTVNSCWPFCPGSPQGIRCELAIDAAKYVSGYLIKSYHLPPLLENVLFKARSSHSPFYGFPSYFQEFKNIERDVRRRSLRYPAVRTVAGESNTVFLPYPEYVCYYFLVKCKGFSSLSDIQKRCLFRFPEFALFAEQGFTREDLIDVFFDNYNDGESHFNISSDYFRYFGDFESFVSAYLSIKDSFFSANYHSYSVVDNTSDFYNTYRSIVVRCQRYLLASGKSIDDFVDFQLDFYNLLQSELLQSVHSDPSVPIVERYDNLNEFHDLLLTDKQLFYKIKGFALSGDKLYQSLVDDNFTSDASAYNWRLSRYFSSASVADAIVAQQEFNELTRDNVLL